MTCGLSTVRVPASFHVGYGYAMLGRLFAIGYITGAREAAYGRPPSRYGRQVSAGALG